MRACTARRDALAAADATQNAQIGARMAATKHVLRGDKAALAAFASTLPRHTPKKRATKAPSAPANSGSTPTATP